MSRYQILVTLLSVILGREDGPTVDAVELTHTTPIRPDVQRVEMDTSCARKNCSYRALILANGLRVVLISNPTAPKAAAALVLRVGALNDYEESPGMANLVGEMVMRLGSQRYPQKLFESSVRDNGGRLFGPNTTEVEQHFGFEVNTDHLGPTLERFAQLFTEPLILSDVSPTLLAETVVEIIEKNTFTPANDDIQSQIRQAEKVFSDKYRSGGTPIHDNETLYRSLIGMEGSEEGALPWGRAQQPQGTELLDKLKLFFMKWYSSNLMSLAVVGKEHLDDLEKMVVPLFRSVRNSHAEKLTFPNAAHPSKEPTGWKTLVQDDDLDIRIVRLVFPIPNVLCPHREASETYVREMIHREGPGSLHSALEVDQLCERVEATYTAEAGGGYFAITCYVHEESDELDEQETTELIFQYLDLLREKGLEEWIFSENQRVNEVKCSTVRYEKNFPSAEYVQKIASSIQNHSLENTLSFEFSDHDWNPTFIKQFLTYLVPENMNLLVFDYDNDEEESRSRKSSETLDPYTFERLPDGWIQELKTLGASSRFSLPSPNEFIPEDATIYPLEKSEAAEPYVVHKSPKSQIWFKQDNAEPKLSIRFNIFSPIIRSRPDNVTLLCILSRLLNAMLKEYEYSARKTGYEWYIISKDNFLHVDVSGLTGKMPLCLEKIVSKLSKRQFEIDQTLLESQFATAKIECIEKMLNYLYEMEDTSSLVELYLRHILLIGTAENWSLNELINTAKRLQFNDVRKFLTAMLSRVYVQGLIYGNATEEMALALAEMIENPVKSAQQILPKEMMSQIVLINDGTHFITNLPSKREHVCHYYSYYQFGIETIQNNVISSVLRNIVENECGKTKIETTAVGSPISAKIFQVHHIIGLLLSTQSARTRQPKEMDFDIEKCLTDVYVTLQNMSDITFEAYKTALLDKLNRAQDSLKELYWSEISMGSHMFDKHAKIIEEVKSLNRTHVLTFFKELLEDQSPTRQKLSVHVYPREFHGTQLDEIPPQAIEIDDVNDFKTTSSSVQSRSPFI